jgi:hypothetical protein
MRWALGPVVAVLAVAWVAVVPAAAQGLDAASSAALAATLRVLQDPALRDAMVSGNSVAAAADRQVQTLLATPALREEFYGVVAAIFAELVQGSAGDTGRMSQALAAAQADPASFVASLSPQTAERLHAFAAKLPSPKP